MVPAQPGEEKAAAATYRITVERRLLKLRRL
jgi:hypothetical protein